MSGEKTNYHTRIPDALFLELDKGATEPISGRFRNKEKEDFFETILTVAPVNVA